MMDDKRAYDTKAYYFVVVFFPKETIFSLFVALVSFRNFYLGFYTNPKQNFFSLSFLPSFLFGKNRGLLDTLIH